LTAQDWVIIIGAIATATVAIIGAIGTLLQEARATRKAIDGRMTELVEATRAGALAQGKLEGAGPADASEARPPSPPTH
jgi:hypothetical protein